MSATYCIYTAVLPRYRQACIDVLLESVGTELKIICSEAHLDQTVKTGIDDSQYERVNMVRFMGRVFVQTGGLGVAIRAQSLIVDWNPRSLTAWGLLFIRRVVRRRTLVWGHLHPRSGRRNRLNPRDWMAKLSSGLITYTYSQASEARMLYVTNSVWVAPNSLFRESELLNAIADTEVRVDAIYVGRLESEKKPELMITAFAEFADSVPNARLLIVGQGTSRSNLERKVRDLNIDDRVVFYPSIFDPSSLAELYATCFASLSPGYVGLGLTQSLSFGVPQIYSRDEPHAPEIELAENWNTFVFETNNAESLTEKLFAAWRSRDEVDRTAIVTRIRQQYTAERMAAGLMAALDNEVLP